MAEKLIGENYTPLDLLAKVTGRARYAEDFPRRWHAVLQTPPEPHGLMRESGASIPQQRWPCRACVPF